MSDDTQKLAERLSEYVAAALREYSEEDHDDPDLLEQLREDRDLAEQYLPKWRILSQAQHDLEQRLERMQSELTSLRERVGQMQATHSRASSDDTRPPLPIKQSGWYVLRDGSLAHLALHPARGGREEHYGEVYGNRTWFTSGKFLASPKAQPYDVVEPWMPKAGDTVLVARKLAGNRFASGWRSEMDGLLGQQFVVSSVADDNGDPRVLFAGSQSWWFPISSLDPVV